MGKISSVFLLVIDWLLLISTRSGSPPLLVLKRLYIHLKTIRLYIVLGSQKNLLQTGTVLSICVKICKVGLEQIYPKKIGLYFFFNNLTGLSTHPEQYEQKKKSENRVFFCRIFCLTLQHPIPIKKTVPISLTITCHHHSWSHLFVYHHLYQLNLEFSILNLKMILRIFY